MRAEDSDGMTMGVEDVVAVNGAAGGCVFLPRGIEDGYRIKTDGDVKLLVITAPAPDDEVQGWAVSSLTSSGSGSCAIVRRGIGDVRLPATGAMLEICGSAGKGEGVKKGVPSRLIES